MVKAASLVIDKCAFRMPVDMAAVCRCFGVRLLPASEYLAQDVEAAALFHLWGNSDGVSMSMGDTHTINYNDRAAPRRVRFTLAEEFMHIMLGHTRDARFNIFDQKYDAEIYAQYEREAKTGAGMLLVPPSLYFRYRAVYGVRQLARLCDVSEACAWTAAQYCEANEAVLRDRFTHRHIECDTRSLTPKRRYRPISVWPADGML